MNRRHTGIGGRCLVLAVLVWIVPRATTRADEPPLVAGQWKATFPDGSVNVYTIDRHGRMQGTVDGKKVTGHAAQQNDQTSGWGYYTHLTFQGSDVLERLIIEQNDVLYVSHYAHKADFPEKAPAQIGQGIRQQPTPPATDAATGVKLSDLAGQWTIIYGGDPYGPIHLYSFDKQGRLRGRECNPEVQLTGQVEQRDGALLLTFNEVDKLERLTLRVDGHLAVEHWAPKSGFGQHGPDWTGVGTPVSGSNGSGIEAVDQRMIDTLNKIGCSGATFALGRGGRIYFTRSYGWSDFEHNVRITPDTPMGIASCEKPITAAAVRQLCAEKKLPLSTSVLKFFKVKPAGPVVDPRVWDITIDHMINHQSGWQPDPINKAWQAYNGSKSPISIEGILPYIAVQRLAFAPGSQSVYDNFGYQVLARMVVHLSGQTYVDYMRHSLLRPYGIEEWHWVRGAGAPEKGEPAQLWNGLIMEEQPEYRIGVSAPAMCTFMTHFWLDGSVRDNGNPTWVKTGGWDNCTSAEGWRPDGVNVAWAFNGRRATPDGQNSYDPGEPLWNDAINWLLAEKKIPAR